MAPAGKVPNANQRARQLGREVDEAENTLATAIGQAVADQVGRLLFAPREVDGQLTPPLFHQVMATLLAPLAPQKTACLYCAARRKLAVAAANEVLAAAQAEYEIVCKAAAELDDAPPEFTPPQLPELPGVQEACTWVPVVAAKGYPPTAVPVCFDDLPTEPADVPAADEPAGPAKAPFRPVGLVTPDGRQILTPNE